MFGTKKDKIKTTIETMIYEIMRREGGYVNHPYDKGGPTNFGITQSTLSSWQDYHATEEDVRNLKESEAREIYRVNYYEITGVYLLPEELQPFMFDSCVNHGEYHAVYMLQNTINRLQRGINEPRSSYTNALRLDGVLGSKTAKAARWLLENAALRLLINRREEFYREIVGRDPTQNVFIKGWMVRLNEFKV